MAWKVKNAWPVKFQYLDVNSNMGEAVIELLEFAHEGISIEYL